jgi:ABC-2 type transport system ATP-binding protein
MIDSPNLKIRNVSFTYPDGHKAVDDISFDLGGGVTGLLGPNGAGKTTLMGILSTFTKATAGNVTWCGMDIAKNPDPLREVLGYLPQHFGIYPTLSAREFLHYLGAVKGLSAKLAKERTAYSLDLVGLSDVADQRLGGFSGGMRQRVGIAQALLNDPKLIIVDEPTVGLDPAERMRFRLLLSDLAQGRIVILSTHIVSDIEASASRLAILSKGKLLFHDSPESLLIQAESKVWEWIIPSSELEAIRGKFVLIATSRCESGVRVRVIANAAPDASAINVPPNLEDAYLSLLNH